VLAQHLHADGALAGNHFGVVERVYEGQALPLFEFTRMGMSFIEGVAEQNHFAAACAHRLDLHCRRGDGHHDYRACSQTPGGKRHTLGVVAR